MNFVKPLIMASMMAVTATGAHAAAKFTPELLNSLGRVSDAQVSPDGKKVLYGVSTPNIENNNSNRELWVMDINGKNAVQITNSEKSETNAVWFEGGKKIAFAYPNEKGVNQMWVMNADGTDRRCVSNMEKDIEGFVLSPDEKKVIIVSTVKYGETTQDRYPDLKKTDGRIIDDLMYRHWNEWTAEIPHPFVGEFNGSEVTALKDVLEGTQFESPMRPWGGVEQLAWLPDSKSLIYVCRKKTGKEYAISTNSDLYQYDIATGDTKNLTEGMMGYDNNPAVSKSGKIAWLSMEHDGYDPNAKYSMKKRIEYKEENYDPNEPLRLNKFLANAGICSRREADEFIQAGVVTVNGEVVTELGTKIKRTDEIKFHDQPVTLEKKVYVLLNKPKDCVTTSDDPQQRKTVMDLVKNVCPERIYPVGRLDRNTTGVLLLTNDGDLASKLTHPKFLKKKVYHVYLDKNVTAHDMQQIAQGIELEDGEIHADAIEYASDTDKSQVGIEIHSGKNRIVRRIFEHLGYRVVKLDRVQFAGLTKKNLRRGDWRFLTEKEVEMLRMGAFE